MQVDLLSSTLKLNWLNLKKVILKILNIGKKVIKKKKIPKESLFLKDRFE